MPHNADIDIGHAAYTKISTAVAELTFQNKSNAKIELTAVATGAAAPAATVDGIIAVQNDGRHKMVVDDVWLHITGSKDVYVKTVSGAGKIFVNYA